MNQPIKLVAHTRQLLKDRPASLTFERIAADTELTVYWLAGFSRSRTEGANTDRVQTLYEYLTGKPLLTINA